MTSFSRQATGSRFPGWLRPRMKLTPNPAVQQQHEFEQKPRYLFGLIHFTHVLGTSVRMQKQPRMLVILFFVLGLLFLTLVVPMSPLRISLDLAQPLVQLRPQMSTAAPQRFSRFSPTPYSIQVASLKGSRLKVILSC